MFRFSRFPKILLISSVAIVVTYSGVRTSSFLEDANQDFFNNLSLNINESFINEDSSYQSGNDLDKVKKAALINQQELIKAELMENNIKSENETFPKISVIFSTWRSGSTFMGDLIQSYPATFYHYEPLLHFNMTRVRSGSLADEGLRVLKNLFQCNYTEIRDYVSYGTIHKWLHDHNWRLWQFCQYNWRLCWDPEFLGKMCELFPYQTMKLVRMRLKLAEDLLKDERLNLKVIYLVRDMRAVWVSRQFPDWCAPSPDCFDPKILCDDMVDDYHSAQLLKAKYPDRFSIVQYEEFSRNPSLGVEKLMKFLMLQNAWYMRAFLESHTKYNVHGPYETKRKSSEMLSKWEHFFKARPKKLEMIQTVCVEAMRLWGYSALKIASKE